MNLLPDNSAEQRGAGFIVERYDNTGGRQVLAVGLLAAPVEEKRREFSVNIPFSLKGDFQPRFRCIERPFHPHLSKQEI